MSFFSLGFGAGAEDRAGRGGKIAVPVLAGEPRETLFGGSRACGEEGGFLLFEADDLLVGWRREPLGRATEAEASLEEATGTAYQRLVELVRGRGRELARIWNYVPRINESTGEGLESYRAFCRGRAVALERAGWCDAPPAGSAVGGAEGELVVMFAATRERAVARENPEQVPAYEYPEDYGPKSPSFSRATQVHAGGRRWTFVSGTAAIKGHASMAGGDLAGQLECTLDNLRLISEACGLGADLAAGRYGAERHFKIYLRRAEDLAEARRRLEGGLLRAGDRVTWLRADICRAELLVEIEATVAELNINGAALALG